MAEMADSERTIWALTEQVRALRARLAEVEAEQDRLRGLLADQASTMEEADQNYREHLRRCAGRLDAMKHARARLAAVEAERDKAEANELDCRRRLAAVLALCEKNLDGGAVGLFREDVRAAATGEDDRG